MCRHRRKPLCRRQSRPVRPSFVTAAASTFYEVLQVSKDADTKTIKKAFKKMALKYHPDVNKEVGIAARGDGQEVVLTVSQVGVQRHSFHGDMLICLTGVFILPAFRHAGVRSLSSH